MANAKLKISLLTLLLVILPVLALNLFVPVRQAIPPTVSAIPTNIVTVKVTKVIDGDTIEIEGGNRIRYLGMDTPELFVSDRETSTCFAREALAENQKLVENTTVQLEKDISETDKYGRLLRYVYKDGRMINLQLVSEGYARQETIPPDVKYAKEFKQAENEARNTGRGLWNSCQ